MPATDDPVVRATGLVRTYGTGERAVHALRGIDLSVSRGEMLGVMGPSGSGKSTLLHILGCLDTPTRGAYCLAGSEVSRLDDEDLSRIRASRIGFVFQAFNLIPQCNVLENVSLPFRYAGACPADSGNRALRALERVMLADKKHRRPCELSGGEVQRVAVARALVADPILVLADEPTGNLDTNTARTVIELFADARQHGTAVIIATHAAHVASACDRVLHLRDGLIEGRDGVSS